MVSCLPAEVLARATASRRVKPGLSREWHFREQQMRCASFSTVPTRRAGQLCANARVVARPAAVTWSRLQVLCRATDDPVAKRARDQQRIEELLPELDELDKDALDGILELELESSGETAETYRHYEIMFLIHEKNADEVQAVIDKVKGFIAEDKGVIYRLNDWGMRNLAYKIKKASRANYVLMNIKITSQAVNRLNTLLEKDERVIRHMAMSQKAAISKDSIPPEEYRPSRIGEEEAAAEDDEDFDDEDESGEEEEEDEPKRIELVFQEKEAGVAGVS